MIIAIIRAAEPSCSFNHFILIHFQASPLARENHKPVNVDIVTIIGLLGCAFYLASHSQKEMVSLRVLAVASNAFFILFSVMHADFDISQLIRMPEFLLNAVLLPINSKRLLEIIRLTKQIEQATVASPVSEWLLPHMYLRKYKAGEVLFRKGDLAREIVYVAMGRLKLQEIDHYLGPGELIGEIGLFSIEKVRTMTVICETDCELYTMTDEMMYRLYYQNPKLGFFFMRLIVERLLADVRRSAIQPETL